jgi:hypothetical protein
MLVLLSFHSDGSLEYDPEGEMKNLPRSLSKYIRQWPVTAFSISAKLRSGQGRELNRPLIG